MFCQGTVFMAWNWFNRGDTQKKNAIRFILGWNFLNKTLNLNFALGSYMGNRAKLLFYSVLFNKFLYFKESCSLRNFQFWVPRLPPIQIPSQNLEIKVLLSEFHHRTNLMALFSSNLGFRKKNQCFVRVDPTLLVMATTTTNFTLILY
jgi:hypothetical protein